VVRLKQTSTVDRDGEPDMREKGWQRRDVRVAPGRWPFIGHGLSLFRHPAETLISLRRYGDVVRIYLGTMPVLVLTDPGLVHQVLAVHADSFGKGMFFEKFRPYFGNGIGMSSGDFYRRQRRLMQPAFHRDRIARYAETMIELATATVSSWRAGQVLEVDDVMQDLSLTITGRTLFGTELGRHAVEEIRRYLPSLLNDGMVRVFTPKVVERLPIPGNRRFDLAIARVNAVVDELIRQGRADGSDRGDLLSTLLLVRDEDTGERMSDRQVHDEVVNLLTAGSETSGVALAWLFHEVGRHPEVERRLGAEVDRVLAGRPVTVEDLPRLTYTRQVINEVLRLHAPWLLMRKAHVDVELGPVRVPAGGEVLVSPLALHHDPRYFPNPTRFDPDRWGPDRAAPPDRHAYLPFGTGLHHCPGHHFAQTEMAIVTAVVAARWRLAPVPGEPLRTKAHGMVYPSYLPMTVIPRKT
jgi:cytochrome P450